MLDTIIFLFPPFLAAFVIAGMHAYLGVHVIKRGIIFVDLAFAQLAGLGAIVGIFLNFADTAYERELALLFIFIGSVVFSFIKSKNKQIPQEAIIGIVYGLALAFSMIVADKISGGSEQIKEILTGSLLWVDWGSILKITIAYAVIAIIHILARGKFIYLTNEYGQEKLSSRTANFWDLLFFLTFGIVISFSVPLAGVLLVFSFLIIPASISTMFFSGWTARILVGWGLSGAAIILGLYYSYSFNAPSGPATILILGIFLIAAFVVHSIISKNLSTENER